MSNSSKCVIHCKGIYKSHLFNGLEDFLGICNLRFGQDVKHLFLLNEHQYRLFCFCFSKLRIRKDCESNKKLFIVIFVITLWVFLLRMLFAWVCIFYALFFSLIMCSCFYIKFVSEPFCEWLAMLVGSYLQLTSVSEEMTKVSCI